MKWAENFTVGKLLRYVPCIKISNLESLWNFNYDKDELVPESESEQREAQVNLTEAVEDPNQSSEEPNASLAQEGKPRSMSYLL